MAVPGSTPLAATNEPLYATQNVPQAAQAGAAVLSPTPGRLFGVTVTTTGANPMTLTDGVGGTVIFAFPASPALGYYPIAGGNPFNTSLNQPGSATNPVIVAHLAPRGTP